MHDKNANENQQLQLKHLLQDNKKAVLDLDVGYFKFLSEDAVLDDKRHVLIPNLGELCPYYDTVREYGEMKSYPEEVFKDNYINEDGKLVDFNEYRLNKAIGILIKWMVKKHLKTQDKTILEEIGRFCVGEYKNSVGEKLIYDWAQSMDDIEKMVSYVTSLERLLEIDSEINRLGREHGTLIRCWESAKTNVKGVLFLNPISYEAMIEQLKIIRIEDNVVYLYGKSIDAQTEEASSILDTFEKVVEKMLNKAYRFQFDMTI